jgi:hypothetical protein
MTQSFADRYKKSIAGSLLLIFYLQTIILPLHAAINSSKVLWNSNYATSSEKVNSNRLTEKKREHTGNYSKDAAAGKKTIAAVAANSPSKTDIGGPSSPEASSFKTVGSNNLVNLFTGDFSYSIPLLDVGGYPVNLFYSGGITMEQEASWVGLGWNINPGTVSRNMRGVPDDFNGEDKLIQTQNVKPNRTWGGEVGIDGELIGIKQPKINLSLGFSFNNYLGPAMEVGAGISLNIPITENVKHDKEAPKNDTVQGLSASVGLNAKLNSRSGLTFSPSLNANLHLIDRHSDYGVGLSTSYNSRTGIKELNITSQASTYRSKKKEEGKGYEKKYSFSGTGSSSISFARPTYIPTLRMPMEYANYSGQIELGAGMFGLRGAAHAQGYYSESKVPAESRKVYKPLVGFIYSEKANGNKDAVMDFNRLNDAEVTPRTPVLSAPQYAYDVFSINGEGTGGTIRAYRGDLGFMRDNETTSKDKNISLGFDIAPAGHWGGNWNIIKTPTRVGGWEDGNNTLRQTLAFRAKETNKSFENIYFRNPGEATVTNTQMINRIGGDNLVRFKLGGSNTNPRLESRLEQFNKNTLGAKAEISIDNSMPVNRDKRTQVTTMLNAEEASVIGLEKTLRNYTGNFAADTTIEYLPVGRTEDFRKKHHISEINVLEQTGMRYVYGLPVYSLKQKDFTFSVENIGDPNTGITTFYGDEPGIDSRHMANKASLDGYVMAQETPAYASSFLLTGLLSPDYIDVTNNGITEDDLGGAVKFDYSKSAEPHKWRTPRSNSASNTAHFNEGLKSEKKDNKANISYGEREVWYLKAIESKSMVAIFKTASREDAKGVVGEMDGTRNIGENANKRLDTIHLYTKAEIKAKGIAAAKPIKSVVFNYDYSLCVGTPDNANGGGKLTLKSVHFSYNGQSRLNKDKYVFNYGNTGSATDNPSYANNASDKWGTYKKPNATDSAANPGGLTNPDFPYTSVNKTRNDEYAAAWSLKKILLPSGGQMEVQYEADDYAYVQDRRACNMFNIYGLGNSLNSSVNNGLYNLGLPFPLNAGTSTDNYYVYIKLPKALQNTDPQKQKKEIFDKYLEGINQLAFKILINMPKGPEPLVVYANYDDYGLCTNSVNNDIIYIKLRPVDGKSPLSKSAIGFITENMPGQAFEGYEIDVDGVKAFVAMVDAMLTTLKGAFKNVDEQMRSAGKARTIILDKSFVRLDNGAKIKYGGGVRVKKVIIKDNWQKMLTGNGSTTYGFTSTYGQEYDYTTIEKINGKESVISSGVASYEPGVGSEENPFREIISFSNKMPLASAQFGAIEMPMLEGLYPAPGVGYSKVTVRSIHRKGTHGDSALRSAIGKQVTEFYTAKEFPAYSAYTPMTSMDFHRNSFFNLLYKDISDRKVTSQGFLVETNDMHGKMKSQVAFSESDEKTPLSYSYHSYKNTGKNGLNDKVNFIYNEQGGAVVQGNMGIDMELMTDVREFRVQSSGFNGQIQTDFFTFVPFPFFIIPMLPIKTYTENKYRAVTCTKLINYHAIEDSVIVMEKGSVVSTKTIAYDAESGAPIVTKTANEFNDPIYNVNYPAYWAYSGMSPAYKNIDRQFTGANFNDGVLSIPGLSENISNVFESGDELYITNPGAGVPAGSCVASSTPVLKLWAFDKNKNTTPLTVTNKDLVFIDSAGNLFNKAGVGFRIIRSGKRNLLGNSVAAATTKADPIATGFLVVNGNTKTVSASAMEFKEKWQTDNEVFKRYGLYYPPAGPGPNLINNGNFSNGFSGFGTDYVYTSGSNTSERQIKVGTNPSSWNPGMANCSDHTSGTGNLLMVNGSTVLGPVFSRIFTQSVSVTPNTDYTLSVWVATLTAANPAVLGFRINVSGLSPTLTASSTTCSWSKLTCTWNSGSNTTAAIDIRDHNNVAAGNDFALDDVYFGLTNAPDMCNPVEALDCGGYLEKKINPYIKGLVGNFKAYRSMVYYGNRDAVATIPNATDIRKNGYLASDFLMYWNFNVAYNLVPDEANTKWVWNSQSMKYNSKGLELETKNALNIYTAAQYGFNKTQPVAITNNSRYNEMFGESFEDYNYNERINPGAAGCVKRHIDFKDGNNIIDATANGFTAHTGKNVMRVNNGTTTKIINPAYLVADDYSLSFTSETTTHLANTGGNMDYMYPYITNTITYAGGSNPGGNNINVYKYDPLATELIDYDFDASQYFEITAAGEYRINLTYTGYMYSNPNGLNDCFVSAAYGLQDINGNYIYGTPIGVGYDPSVCGYGYLFNQYTLCPGKYKIMVSGRGYHNMSNNSFSDNFNISCVDLSTLNPLPLYKDLSTVNGCTFNKPIAATTDMQNPVFAPYGNKKMLFSAWVKEDCNTPCAAIDFTNSNIEIWAVGINLGLGNIKRRGAIIEGWQKIEGEFTIPGYASTAEIRFINSNAAPMYVDDIRIHPFNANMKTYTYDARTLRLAAELDENNYASFYEYDEEGQLVRVKKETSQGIKTINETRASKQKTITDLQ